MDIRWTHTWPEASQGTLIVLPMWADDQDQFHDILPTGLDLSPNVDTQWIEKGNQHLAIDEKQIVSIWGMGSERDIEAFRQMVHKVVSFANDYQYKEIIWINTHLTQDTDLLLALAESLILSNYQFLSYKSEGKINSLQKAAIWGEPTPAHREAIKAGVSQSKSACIARDLVNEPLITLTAEALSKRIESLGEQFGFQVDVLHKQRIQALKMGGLLAVNAGSPDPPTFSILEYCPAGMEEMPPVILVGKGVVFDTGGLSLKPTANSMDFMKADMAGAAAVIGAICGIADRNLPLRVIGLVPATDNRPGGNAYVPGDVIRMYDGSTVEVLNTDAEGRMILADALAYAKQYDPALVIDLATLTGSAVVAVGVQGIALMRTAEAKTSQQLIQAGKAVHERLVEFPLWKEYGELLRSDIADVKNIGGRYAGAITAGKFLEHFTDYPWMHLDIAGPSWLTASDSYRGKNGTGVGVRLLIEFLANHYEHTQ